MLLPVDMECLSFADFDTVVEHLMGEDGSEWIFRGQREASWRLASRLERFCQSTASVDLWKFQQRLAREFIAKAHLYGSTGDFPDTNEFVRWLVVMQHYGVPTLLLDWTLSAYMALYFAVEQPSQTGYCAVWAFDTAALIEVDDKYRSAWEKRDSSLPRVEKLVFVDPDLHVARSASQQACFLSLYPGSDSAFENALAELLSVIPDKKRLYKLRFPADLRRRLLQRLINLNIHPATLFPDLDGLARFITLKNELQLANRTAKGAG